MPISAGNIVQHQSKLITVSLNTDLTQALALMIEHDFSQLPVVDADFKPLGIVTTDGIARALLTLGTTIKGPRVKDAITKPPIFRADEDLLYLLDYLLKASAVFIINDTGKLIGIITDYDTTQYFRQRAEDIVLVEDIESTLKSHLRAAYGATERENDSLHAAINSITTAVDDNRKKSLITLKMLCKNKQIQHSQEELDVLIDKHFPIPTARSFDSLTLSEYIQCAQKAWNKLEPVFDITKSSWSEMMDSIREIRNKLVHFRGEVSPVERAKLRYCAEWFKNHQPFQESINEPDNSGLFASNEQSNKSETSLGDTKNEIHGDSALQPKDDDNSKGYARLVGVLQHIEPEYNFTQPTLKMIEKAIKGPLPKAAYEHITWWTDDSAHSRLWINAGWRVTSVQLNSLEPRVYFSRISHK